MPSGAKVIAQDGNIVIWDGGPYSVQNPPNYGAVISLQYLLKRATKSEEVTTRDACGWADFDEEPRPVHRRAVVTLTLLVAEQGALDITPGNFIKAEIYSGGSASSQTFEGILIKDTGTYELDEFTVQDLEIVCRRDRT